MHKSSNSHKQGTRNSSNYHTIPYNQKLRDRAREMRKSRNLPEVILWKELRNRNFKNCDFDRQKIIGNFIVDFFCAYRNIVIEVDGSSHKDKAEYDAERDAYLIGLGLTVIHIHAEDVLYNLDGVLNMLKNDYNL